MNKAPDSHADLQRKNTKTGLIVLGIFVGMVALSFAAVPFYDLFCRVTGYGGTTRVAESLPNEVLERKMTIQFSANIARDMPWDFTPNQKEIEIHVGQRGITSFNAKNTRDIPTGGTALYNVTPLKAGKYFHKIQCFCFDEQILEPGQEVTMPVVFYIDPSIQDDPNMDDVTTITLSYTFFSAESKALDDALEAFYNSDQHAINTD